SNARDNSYPPPHPSPTRGEGADRVCVSAKPQSRGQKKHTPGGGAGGADGMSGEHWRAPARASGRLLVFLVVVDLGELRVDHVLFLLAARSARTGGAAGRARRDRRVRGQRLPAATCTSPRRASSTPGPTHWSWR